MPWLKLDDGIMDDSKVIQLSDAAFRVWMRGLAYAARKLTDGFIPHRLAKEWGSLKRIGELLSAGLWHDGRSDCGCQTAPYRGYGYYIHDYLQWNDSRAKILSRRQWDSDRKAGRNPDGFRRGFPIGVEKGSKEQQESFARFWSAYPRRIAEEPSRAVFLALLEDGIDAEAVITGAEAYARSVKGGEQRFIASPLNWLNDARWTDELERPDLDREREVAEAKRIIEEGRG